MRLRAIGLILAMGTTVPATASADGLPVGNVDAGRAGAPSPDGVTRYVTRRLGHDTRVAELGGPRRSTVVRSRVVRGRYTIPAVALDATPSGLSADGRTLVLINPRRTFPRERTAFTVLDAKTLRVRTLLDLQGDYSFDALSPNGRWLYLIQYTSRDDPRSYAVRAYDLRSERMLPRPIVDPREPDEAMRGYPITRETGPGGRWEYTLYDGAGAHPFVHALDTVGQKALCLDLDDLRGYPNLHELRLEVGPDAQLTVLDGATPLALIDRNTGRAVQLTAPGTDPPPRAEPLPDAVQVALVGLLAAALLGSAAALAIGRRAPISHRTAEDETGDEHWYPAP